MHHAFYFIIDVRTYQEAGHDRFLRPYTSPCGLYSCCCGLECWSGEFRQVLVVNRFPSFLDIWISEADEIEGIYD
jgi:hypothetical protein